MWKISTFLAFLHTFCFFLAILISFDDELQLKEPQQRGRKKKLGKKSLEYIVTKIETIGEQNYLVDDRNFVFSFDTKDPEFLGIKHDGRIKTLSDLGVEC